MTEQIDHTREAVQARAEAEAERARAEALEQEIEGQRVKAAEE